MPPKRRSNASQWNGRQRKVLISDASLDVAGELEIEDGEVSQLLGDELSMMYVDKPDTNSVSGDHSADSSTRTRLEKELSVLKHENSFLRESMNWCADVLGFHNDHNYSIGGYREIASDMVNCVRGLQRKLEDALNGERGLERKLEEALDHICGLERKLENAKEHICGLERKLEDAKEHICGLERKLENANVLACGLEQRLEEARVVDSGLQRKLQDAVQAERATSNRIESLEVANYSLINSLGDEKFKNCLLEKEKVRTKVFTKPFDECTKSTRFERIKVVSKAIDAIAGAVPDQAALSHQRSAIHTALRVRCGVTRDSELVRMSPEKTLTMQVMVGLSDSALERIRYFLIRENRNILASQGSLRQKRVDLWNKEKWSCLKDKSGVMISQQLRDVRTTLVERVKELWDQGMVDIGGNFCGALWFSVIGDKGSTTTKVALEIANIPDANSVDNLTLIGRYLGPDDYKGMKDHLSSVISQVNELCSNPVIEFEDNDGIQQSIPVEMFLTGDYKFLCSVLGHGGQSCSYNCIFCVRRTAGQGAEHVTIGNADLMKRDDEAPLRKWENYVDPSLSVANKPLFTIPPTHVIPPSLHIFMGLIKPFMNALENELLGRDLVHSGYPSLYDKRSAENEVASLNEKLENLKGFHQNLETEHMWCNTALVVLHEYKNGKLNPRCPQGDAAIRCDEFCLLRSKTLSRFPVDMKDLITCVSCGGSYHMFCCGAYSQLYRDMIRTINGQIRCSMRPQCCVGVDTATVDVLDDRIKTAQEQLAAWKSKADKAAKDVHDCEAKIDALKEVILRNSGPNALALEEVYKKLGVTRKKYFNQFTGNDVYRLLHKDAPKLLWNLSTSPMKDEYRVAMEALAKLQSAAKARFLSDTEVIEFDTDVANFRKAMIAAEPSFSVTPKAHMLLRHVSEFMHRFKTWGKISEQPIEALHALINRIEPRFYAVKDEEHKWLLITRELTIRSALKQS